MTILLILIGIIISAVSFVVGATIYCIKYIAPYFKDDEHNA